MSNDINTFKYYNTVFETLNKFNKIWLKRINLSISITEGLNWIKILKRD